MQNNRTLVWWEKTTKTIFIITLITVLIYFFSHWAINAEYFGKNNHSNSIGYGFISVLSIVMLLGAAPIAALGVVMGLFLKQSFKYYLVTLAVSLASVLYINTFHS